MQPPWLLLPLLLPPPLLQPQTQPQSHQDDAPWLRGLASLLFLSALLCLPCSSCSLLQPETGRSRRLSFSLSGVLSSHLSCQFFLPLLLCFYMGAYVRFMRPCVIRVLLKSGVC